MMNARFLLLEIVSLISLDTIRLFPPTNWAAIADDKPADLSATPSLTPGRLGCLNDEKISGWSRLTAANFFILLSSSLSPKILGFATCFPVPGNIAQACGLTAEISGVFDRGWTASWSLPFMLGCFTTIGHVPVLCWRWINCTVR